MHRRNEAGFTLPEVLITIVILGILVAIAMPVWNGVVESRRLDSAANQVASDLRLAHTRAVNQLSDFEVAFYPVEANPDDPDDPDYIMSKPSGPDGTVQRRLPDGVKAEAAITMRFESNGSVTPVGSGTITVRVEAVNNTSEHRDIKVNTATSKVEVVVP